MKIDIETNGAAVSHPAPPGMAASRPVHDRPLHTLLDSAHEAFISMDSEGHVLVWNRMASETFGWSEEEACGCRLGDLIVPERYLEAA
jgi:PAS domain S-box-containing protein